MSNDSVRGGIRDDNSQVGVQRAAGEGRSVEEQLQELRNMMANLATQVGQIATGQAPRVNQPIPPPVVNQQAIPPVMVDGVRMEEVGGEINRGRRYRGDIVYREGGGDNFDDDYYQNREFRPPRGLEYVKLRMPSFAGSGSADDYLDWEDKVEGLFECYDIDDHTRVRLAAVEFTGYAALWWKNLIASRRRDGEADVRTWHDMKRIMRRRFIPEHYRHELFMRLQTLRQGGKTVDEYVQEFETLMIRCGTVEPPEQTMARFVTGLKYEISCIVELQRYSTLEEAIQLALKVERQRRANPHKSNNSRYDSSTKSYHSDGRKAEKSNTTVGVKKEKDVVEKEKVVYGADKGKEVAGSSSSKARQIKCFKCLGMGHIASQCPNRRVMAIIEGESEDDEGEKEEEGEAGDLSASLDEYYGDTDAEVYGDRGEDQYLSINVLRRVMTTAPSTEEEQRENLFHISCRVKGNLCALIIDGGSCTNVVAASLVEKLKLVTTQHPKPYKLH